jgi:hypothetical protein
MLSLSLKVTGLSNMKEFFYTLAVGIIVIVVNTFLLQWLWNITLPELFNTPFLNFGQALAFIIMSNILFSNGGAKKKSE